MLVSGAMVSVSAVERGWSVERGGIRVMCNGMYIYMHVARMGMGIRIVYVIYAYMCTCTCIGV